MLKNLDPLLTPEVLFLLARLGHGDDLALVDANFPADSLATRGGAHVVRLAGASLPEAARAIASVFPLDGFVDDPIRRMAVVDAPADLPDVQAEALRELKRAEPSAPVAVAIERFDFYAQAERAVGIIATTDRRAYGCLLLRKGVVFGAARVASTE